MIQANFTTEVNEYHLVYNETFYCRHTRTKSKWHRIINKCESLVLWGLSGGVKRQEGWIRSNGIGRIKRAKNNKIIPA